MLPETRSTTGRMNAQPGGQDEQTFAYAASGSAVACSWKRVMAVWISFTESGPFEANSITFNTRLRSKAMPVQ